MHVRCLEWSIAYSLLMYHVFKYISAKSKGKEKTTYLLRKLYADKGIKSLFAGK